MSPPDNDNSRERADASHWVDEHADVLYGYALQRVRRRDVAEELVQETFLAALRARKDFAGESSERTWLVGILRHKIVDHIRREAQVRSREKEDRHDTSVDRFFKKDGHWKNGSQNWGVDPVALLEKRDFWMVFEKCFSGLPRKLADAFVLRELEELQPGQVCANLRISESNLWVRLHRARVLLKECLELHWFRSKSRK